MISVRASQTALEVALALVTLGEKEEWRQRLPGGLVELSERLISNTGLLGYAPVLTNWSRTPLAVNFYDCIECFLPGIFEGLGKRKIFMNEQVLTAIESGAEQVLVLGAGLDTLCMRLAPDFPKVTFFEVDHPATSAAKARAVAEEGQPQNMILIAADLGKTPLSELMMECQHWNSAARSILVAEGLLLYLEREKVLDLFFGGAACTAPGSQLAFSYLVDPVEYPFVRSYLWLLGEPWLSSAKSAELPDYIGPNWKVVSTREANPRKALEGFAVAERVAI